MRNERRSKVGTRRTLAGTGPRLAAATVAVLLAWAIAPRNADAGVLREPVQVRIEGYIDASEKQVNPWAMLDIWLERAPNRKFALTNLIILSASDVSSGDIVAAVQPLHPNFIFNGDKSLLDKISTAQPNQYLQITGYTAFGPQRILVNQVERSEPITGPTPTPSLSEKLFGF